MTATPRTAASAGVSATPAALKFIQRMVRFGGSGGGFRLEVSPGGCSGMSSQFSVESAPRLEDRVVVLEGGLRLFLPPESYALLDGITIDFIESATESRLAFIDPKATGCGCATKGPSLPTSNLS